MLHRKFLDRVDEDDDDDDEIMLDIITVEEVHVPFYFFTQVNGGVKKVYLPRGGAFDARITGLQTGRCQTIWAYLGFKSG